MWFGGRTVARLVKTNSVPLTQEPTYLRVVPHEHCSHGRGVIRGGGTARRPRLVRKAEFDSFMSLGIALRQPRSEVKLVQLRFDIHEGDALNVRAEKPLVEQRAEFGG